MTLEELKEFEKTHSEYGEQFPRIMGEFNEVCKEEFSKAFKAINERMKARQEETTKQFHVPEEEYVVANEAFTEFLKQVNADFIKNFKIQFSRNQDIKALNDEQLEAVSGGGCHMRGRRGKCDYEREKEEQRKKKEAAGVGNTGGATGSW